MPHARSPTSSSLRVIVNALSGSHRPPPATSSTDRRTRSPARAPWRCARESVPGGHRWVRHPRTGQSLRLCDMRRVSAFVTVA
jgi:hypothetical protein